MRRMLLTFAIASLAAAAVAATTDVYYVVLKDGSWVRAAEKPVVEEGVAQVRLPGGLLAQLDAAAIDWQRSDDRSRQRDILFAAEPERRRLPEPRKQIEGTLTIVNPEVEDAPRVIDTTTPAAEAPPIDPSSSVRNRIRALDTSLAELQGRRRELERQASQAIVLDEATALRQQVAQIDQEIQRVRDERERLLRQMYQQQQP